MSGTLGGGSVVTVTGQVILLGATGFTGRLTAEAMTRAGLAPVLAGRSAEALVALTGDVAGLGPIDAPPTWRTADVTDPASVRALVTSPDDVLVTTVGPFTRLGRAAVEAAIEQGCGYVDSTGEPPFIRAVFEEYGPRAEATGARLLTAFGYDYVPGNLAAALAIADARAAGRIPVTVEIGYFIDGTFAISSGTRASAAVMAAATPFALRNGRIVDHAGRGRPLRRRRPQRDAMPVSGSEHFTLTAPRPGRARRRRLPRLGGTMDARRARGGRRRSRSGHACPLLGSAVRAGVGTAAGGATGEGPSAGEAGRGHGPSPSRGPRRRRPRAEPGRASRDRAPTTSPPTCSPGARR